MLQLHMWRAGPGVALNTDILILSWPLCSDWLDSDPAHAQPVQPDPAYVHAAQGSAFGSAQEDRLVGRADYTLLCLFPKHVADCAS